jgi:tRNA(Ile)-lysidine synthase
MGPAPAVAVVRSAVRDALRDDSGPVLVACSGGADSLALAAAAAFVAPRCGVPAGLVTIDHGLQPGSAQQAAVVAAIGAELGFDPVEIVPVTVGTAGGPEAAARTARYAALDAVAVALDARVLLGHTLDDQAETVLLGLGRGSGPRSIAGMAPRDGRWLRPLLRLRRATTVAACAALGFTPWQDPHNADPAFQRARLRTEALPLLEDVLQGGVAEALARTADLLRDDLASLDAWADSVISTAGDPLVVAALADLPRAVRTRALRAWAATHGAAPLSAERTAALDGLLVAWRGQGPIDLPGGVLVRRTSGTLEAYPLASETPESRTPPAPQE